MRYADLLIGAALMRGMSAIGWFVSLVTVNRAATTPAGTGETTTSTTPTRSGHER